MNKLTFDTIFSFHKGHRKRGLRNSLKEGKGASSEGALPVIARATQRKAISRQDAVIKNASDYLVYHFDTQTFLEMIRP